MLLRNNQIGISPVISVILMVAVVVALVALVTILVFDFGDSTGESSDITLDTSETSEGLQITSLRNENVENIIVQGPNERIEEFEPEAGSSITIGDGVGTYIVSAELPDGSEEIVETVNIDENSVVSDARTPTDETTGTVSVNPEIPNANVKSVEDGIIIDETTTDENGNYQIGVSDNADIVVNTEADVEVDGNDFYAGHRKPVVDVEESIDFEFEEGIETDVDGETIQVSYQITDGTENQITNAHQLQGIDEDLEASYELADDIDVSTISNYESVALGFGNEFTGTLDGNDNTVLNLDITVSEDDPAGIFSIVEDGEIRNLNVEGNIIEEEPVDYEPIGLVAGEVDDSTIENVEVNSVELDLAGDDNEPVVSGMTGVVVGEAGDDNEFNNIAVRDSISINSNEFVDEVFVDEELSGVITSGGGDDNTYTNIVFEGDITLSGETEDEFIDSVTAGVISDPGGNNNFEDISMNGNILINGYSNDDDIISDEMAGVISDPSSDNNFQDISMNGDITVDGIAEGGSLIGFGAETAGVVSDPGSNNFEDISMNGDFTITGESEDEFIDSETAGVISRPGADNTFTNVSMKEDLTIEGELTGDEVFIDDNVAGVISDLGGNNNLDDINMNSDIYITGELSDSNAFLLDDGIGGVISDVNPGVEIVDLSMNGDIIIETGSDTDIDSEQFYDDEDEFGSDTSISALISDVETEDGLKTEISGILSHNGDLIVEEEPQDVDDHVKIGGILSQFENDEPIDFDKSIDVEFIGTMDVGGDEITAQDDDQVALGFAVPVQDEDVSVDTEE